MKSLQTDDKNTAESSDAASGYLRESLYNKLESHRNVSLIGIFANSGFGKTVLMYSYLLHYNINNIWCGIDSIIRYDAHLLSNIRKEVLELLPEESDTPYSPKELSAEDEIDSIISKLNALTAPLFIVFDNYHMTSAQSDIHKFIARVIEATNPLVTIVIMGKQRPDFSLPLLKSKKRYYELDADDLAFSRRETEDYFNNYNNLNLKPYELDWIYEITQGWPASYQLILEYIQKFPNPKRNRLDFHLLSNVPDIFDYLSNEVFECETEEIKDFMLKTSLMTELEPDIVDHFLEINRGEEIIRYLLDNHAFVYKNEYGAVRYHKLFRQFLYERYYHFNAGKMSQQHNKLTEIYMQRHSYILAFAHAVASNDYKSATKIIKLIGHRYNAMQFINVIDGHLEEISPKLLFSNTSLFLARCIPESILIEFIDPLNDAIHTAEMNQNIFLLSNLQNRLGTFYYHTGRISEAKEMFEKSYQNATEFNDYALIACNLQLIAECHICMGSYEKSLEYARQALFISERHHIVIMQVHTLEVLTRLYIALKDYGQAEFYLSQAFGLAEEEPFISFWLLTDKSTLLTEKKEYDAAIIWAKKSIDSVIEYSDGYDIALSYLTLGNAYLQSGKFRQAEWSLNIAYESCLKCGYLHYSIVKKQLELYTLMDEADRIRSKKQELSEICRKYKYEWVMDISAEGSDSDFMEPSDQEDLKISTLGSFHIVLNGKDINIKRNSSLRILQFLIVNRKHKINKDIIIDAVFPGIMYDNANHFNVALSVLRKALEPDLKSGKNSKYILRTKECYQLSSNGISLDIDEFDDVCNCIMNRKDVIDESLLNKLDLLYKGDFFEEYPYEPFLEIEREKINVKYIHTLKHIANFFKDKKDYLKGQDYYEKILAKEPYMEDIYFEYIDMLLASHAVFQAKNIAKKMTDCLEKELKVPVKDKINKLFEEYHFTFDA